MPQQDGLAALKRIKAIDPGASVIMISSNGHDINVSQALSDGALDFIQKPFAGADVCSKVENALRRSKIAN
jgi:two-component system chemotaxis response regulator CheY